MKFLALYIFISLKITSLVKFVFSTTHKITPWFCQTSINGRINGRTWPACYISSGEHKQNNDDLFKFILLVRGQYHFDPMDTHLSTVMTV
jgi:hypothetical protein